MPIVSYIDFYFSALVNLIFYLFIIKKVFNCSFKDDKLITLIVLIIVSVFVAMINIFNKDIFKVLLTFPFGVILFKTAFNVDYKKSILFMVVATIYMFVGEILASIVLSLLPFDYTFLFKHILGTTVGTILVSVFTILLLYINILSKAVNKIVSNINERSTFIVTLILVVFVGAIAYRNTTGTAETINIIVNAIVAITFIIILYVYYQENNKVQELSKNYNIMFQYLEKYEKELVEKRKIIHDYKNELIIINGYIGDNKKLKEYVEELLQEQRNIAENSVIRNIDKLPRGLKGLIYYKFSFDSNIKVDLQVAKSLKKFDKLSSKTNKDVLKIIGILIDNAIEAVETETDKYINIKFSINKNVFKMEMVNKCTKNIDNKNLMEVGYSTKGKDRGYGLVLVKDILKKEKAINLKLNVKSDEFISTLEVKL